MQHPTGFVVAGHICERRMRYPLNKHGVEQAFIPHVSVLSDYIEIHGTFQ